MPNPNEAICHYCGEKLPHEKCSEKFTEKGRAFISQVLNNWGLVSVRSWVIEACAEIDRLAAKREHLLEKVALQEKEIERLTAELAAKNKALEYIACSCQDCPDLDTVLCEHNEYCVNKVAQQALKENDG